MEKSVMFENGDFVGSNSYYIFNDWYLPVWISYTVKEMLTFDGVQAYKLSVDRVSQFSVRPPGLHYLFDTLREYYLWFEYRPKIFKGDSFITNLSDDIFLGICWCFDSKSQSFAGRLSIDHHLFIQNLLWIDPI